jgi:hypothetical protein
MSDFALPDDTLRALLTHDKAALAEQSAAGRGYVLTVTDVQRTYTAPVVALDGDMVMARQDDPNAPYIPEDDITETLPDGRVIQVAAKGTPVPHPRAVQLGLIKPTKASGPTEVKNQAALERVIADQEAARVNAQAAQAMQENTGDPEAVAPSVAQTEAEQAAAEDAKDRQAASAKAKK